MSEKIVSSATVEPGSVGGDTAGESVRKMGHNFGQTDDSITHGERNVAMAVAASLEAVMPLLKTVQQFAPPDYHDEIIARAEHNLAAFKRSFK